MITNFVYKSVGIVTICSSLCAMESLENNYRILVRTIEEKGKAKSEEDGDPSSIAEQFYKGIDSKIISTGNQYLSTNDPHEIKELDKKMYGLVALLEQLESNGVYFPSQESVAGPELRAIKNVMKDTIFSDDNVNMKEGTSFLPWKQFFKGMAYVNRKAYEYPETRDMALYVMLMYGGGTLAALTLKGAMMSVGHFIS